MFLIINKDHNIRSPQSQVAEVLDTDNIAILYYKWHMVVWTIWIWRCPRKMDLAKKIGSCKIVYIFILVFTHDLVEFEKF